MRPVYKLVVALVAVILLGAGCSLFGSANIARTEKFSYPDIKDDFCGVSMDFRYCKCAFHNEYCDDIGMSKREADKYVQAEFDKWVNNKLATWGESCKSAGGIFTKDKCEYCAEGYLAQGQACVEQSASVQNDTGIDKSVFNDDCTVKDDVLANDWKKYSDIDNVIPYNERSYEAKQVYDLQEKRIALMVEGFNLEAEQEADKQTRVVLEEYRQALVANIKTNLLKAFWRLTWITYSTIDSAKGLGKTYGGLVEDGIENVGSLAKGAQVIQGLVPGSSALAIDTNSVSGKVKSTSVNTALEAVASLGDPITTGTEFVKSSISVNYPSADITDEEVAILRNQNISKGALDEALKAGDAVMAEREARMQQIETEITALEVQIAEWEGKEKDRVKFNLEDSCKK